ncbi:DUF2809 domain-containing protein [Mucilaginibacter sp. AW1-3]
MIQFNIRYFALTVILFFIELYIGFCVRDAIIRPYGGDLLIGIFIYCFLKSFINAPVMPVAILVLMVCYIAEVLQYLHFLNYMGWQNSHLARMVFGVGFSWIDMLCYTAGMLIVLLAERARYAIQKF